MITVDLAKIKNEKNVIFHCIGSGKLNLALRKDYMNSLKQVQKDLKFRYIRAHGIFSKGMGIYREYEQDGEKRIIYNFTYLDQIFDSFLEINIRPFLELGFMPNELASDKNTVFWWEGNVTPPKDYGQWNELVDATFKHLIKRYGIEEISQWPIEVWNEPNLDNFWKDADQSEYFRLYQETALTIKKIDQRLRVGGPVICGGSDYWLKDFLEYCKTNNLPLDFLSRHAYSSEPSTYHGLLCEQQIMPVSALINDFKTGHEYLEKYYHKNIPVYISEFNTSYTPDNPVHDTAFNAAYLAPLLSQGSDLVDSFSYWTFSDMFEEKGVPASFLHGGFGLLTYGQIKKPTYYIYEFFAQLENKLLYKDNNCHIAMGKNGELVVIAWNSTNESKKLDFTFNGKMNSENKFFAQTIVNESVGNVDTVWRQLGMPRFPSQNQLAMLRKASQPQYRFGTLKIDNSSYKLTVTLQKNEITMIQVYDQAVDVQSF